MLKIGQKWEKLQIIPPNAQQRSAPLPKENLMFIIDVRNAKVFDIRKN